MAISHTNLVKLILKKTCDEDVATMWQNQTGLARSFDNPKRIIAFGLKGSTDTIGLSRSGRFIGAEVKVDEDFMKEDQINFKEMVLRNNGLHFEIRSEDDINAMINIIREDTELKKRLMEKDGKKF